MSDQPPQDHGPVSAPDSKSSREAELEELRRQNLAQSNAQRLAADTAATPVNMLDWQAQQKALRDQERMSKTESEQLLHNFRGGNTDEISSKLSSLKQEDRKHKQDAERLLRSYRADPSLVGTRKSPAKSPRPNAAPGASQQEDQRTGEETVASLAAGFNHNGVPDTMPAMPAAPVKDVKDSMVDDTMVAFSTAGTTVKELEESTESMVIVDTPPPQPSTSTSSEPLVPPKEGKAPPAATSMPTDKDNTDDWVSVESSNVPSPERVEEMLSKVPSEDKRVGSFDSNEVSSETMSRAVTEVAGNIEDEDDIDDTLTEAKLHASASAGGHLSLRLDVEFSFGLISHDVQPNTEKYMNAVATIAHSGYAERRPAGVGGHAIYNTAFEPFVRLVEDDVTFSRDDSARRFLVHASLPMFILNWGEATTTRVGVRDALKAALEEGRLLSLAVGGN